MNRRIARSFRVPVLAVLATALVWSCADQPVEPTSSLEGPINPTLLQRDLAMVIEVQERHTPELMQATGVVGTAVSIGADGEPVVTVLAKDGSHGSVPRVLEGVPVEVRITGEFRARPPFTAQPKPTCGKKNLPPCPPPGPAPPGLNERHPRPVPIGVSSGHPAITAGTLGARVKRGGQVFALSNNHVYADEGAASIGDDLIQPGTFDGGSSPADDLATLADFEPIVFGGACVNVIDAAIGAATTADIGNSTPSGIGYGTPRTQTMAPALNMRVKKVGRTTGFTKGTISAINATVNVGYDSGVACFTGQIITNRMSSGGDSGSLVVVDGRGKTRGDDRKPVGLLYAGSSTSTVLNPIGPVLTRFNVTIDGN